MSWSRQTTPGLMAQGPASVGIGRAARARRRDHRDEEHDDDNAPPMHRATVPTSISDLRSGLVDSGHPDPDREEERVDRGLGALGERSRGLVGPIVGERGRGVTPDPLERRGVAGDVGAVSGDDRRVDRTARERRCAPSCRSGSASSVGALLEKRLSTIAAAVVLDPHAVVDVEERVGAHGVVRRGVEIHLPRGRIDVRRVAAVHEGLVLGGPRPDPDPVLLGADEVPARSRSRSRRSGGPSARSSSRLRRSSCRGRSRRPRCRRSSCCARCCRATRRWRCLRGPCSRIAAPRRSARSARRRARRLRTRCDGCGCPRRRCPSSPLRGRRPTRPTPPPRRRASVTPVTKPSTNTPVAAESVKWLFSTRMFDVGASYSAPCTRSLKPSRRIRRLLEKPSTMQLRTVTFVSATDAGVSIRIPCRSGSPAPSSRRAPRQSSEGVGGGDVDAPGVGARRVQVGGPGDDEALRRLIAPDAAGTLDRQNPTSGSTLLFGGGGTQPAATISTATTNPGIAHRRRFAVRTMPPGRSSADDGSAR